MGREYVCVYVYRQRSTARSTVPTIIVRKGLHLSRGLVWLSVLVNAYVDRITVYVFMYVHKKNKKK